MNIYYRILDWYLVKVLRRTVNTPHYYNAQYMCHAIKKYCPVLVVWFLQKRIHQLINHRFTLYSYISGECNAYGPTYYDTYSRMSMEERHPIHNAFWMLAIKHLEKGNKGPVEFELSDIGIIQKAFNHA